MTADTTALQERVAEELYYEQYPEGRHRSEWPAAVYPDTVYEYRDLAATVLPIIAAEVRAASERAYERAKRDMRAYLASGNLNGDEYHAEPINPYRYEQEAGHDDER